MSDPEVLQSITEEHVNHLQQGVIDFGNDFLTIWNGTYDPTNGWFGDYIGHRASDSLDVMHAALRTAEDMTGETKEAVEDWLKETGTPSDHAIYEYGNRHDLKSTLDFWAQPEFASLAIIPAFRSAFDNRLLLNAEYTGGIAGYNDLGQLSSAPDAGMAMQQLFGYPLWQELNGMSLPDAMAALHTESLPEVTANAIKAVMDFNLALATQDDPGVDIPTGAKWIDQWASKPDIRDGMRAIYDETILDFGRYCTDPVAGVRMVSEYLYGEDAEEKARTLAGERLKLLGLFVTESEGLKAQILGDVNNMPRKQRAEQIKLADFVGGGIDVMKGWVNDLQQYAQPEPSERLDSVQLADVLSANESGAAQPEAARVQGPRFQQQ